MNALQSFLSSEVVTAFGWALLHSLWQGALIALLAAIIMAFQGRYNPKIRYAVFLGLLMLIPVSFALTFALIFDAGTDAMPQATQQQFIAQSLVSPGPAVSPGKAATGFSGLISGINSFFEGRMHWLFLFWLGGFLVFTLRFAGSMAYIYRLRTFRLMEISGDMQMRLEGLSKQIGVKKLVRLKESALVQVPVTIGYLRPIILFPIGLLSGVPMQQLEAILLHELAHIRRRDYLLNILQSLVEMLFFYHPATWWLSGLVRVEREHICDDIALSIHHDRINYIKALTTMEEMNVKSPILATAVTGPRKKLLQRVTRLVHPEKFSKGISDGIIGILMLAAVVITISANAIAIAGSGDEPLGNESLDGFRISVPALNNFTEIETAVISPEDPDTVITKSGSGKVIVKVVSDSTDYLKEKEVEVTVFPQDEEEWQGRPVIRTDKKIITLRMEGEGNDSLKSVIVIRDDDSVKVYSKELEYDWFPADSGLVFKYPHDFDFDFDYDFDYDEEDMDRWMQQHEQAMREFEKALKEHQFQIPGEEMERVIREYERAIREYELKQEDFERQLRERERHVLPPASPEPPLEWYGTPPQLPDMSTEKVIRQELRDDGLVSPGKSYIIEINSKSMYINGEKQSKEVAKKYMHLIEGLEPGMLDENGTFKLVF